MSESRCRIGVVVDRRQQPRRRNAVSTQSVAASRAAQPLEPRRAGRPGPERMLPLTKFVSARDVQKRSAAPARSRTGTWPRPQLRRVGPRSRSTVCCASRCWSGSATSRGRSQQVSAGRKSEATFGFYREKTGHWLRVLGEDFPLARLSATDVDRYITHRRSKWSVPPRDPVLDEEGNVLKPARAGRHVTDHTIAKELVALRGA
jgi:hypothetical protein